MHAHGGGRRGPKPKTDRNGLGEKREDLGNREICEIRESIQDSLFAYLASFAVRNLDPYLSRPAPACIQTGHTSNPPHQKRILGQRFQSVKCSLNAFGETPKVADEDVRTSPPTLSPDFKNDGQSLCNLAELIVRDFPDATNEPLLGERTHWERIRRGRFAQTIFSVRVESNHPRSHRVAVFPVRDGNDNF